MTFMLRCRVAALAGIVMSTAGQHIVLLQWANNAARATCARLAVRPNPGQLLHRLFQYMCSIQCSAKHVLSWRVHTLQGNMELVLMKVQHHPRHRDPPDLSPVSIPDMMHDCCSLRSNSPHQQTKQHFIIHMHHSLASIPFPDSPPLFAGSIRALLTHIHWHAG